MKHEFSQQIFEKNIFYGNLSNGSRVVHADGQTDMTKLILVVMFCNYANAPKKDMLFVTVLLCSVWYGGLVVPLHISCVCECGIYA